MNINEKFAVWCTRRCFHLWEPPYEVYEWLDDPTDRMKAAGAAGAAEYWGQELRLVPVHSVWAARATMLCARTDPTASLWTSHALYTTVTNLKCAFVSTLTDDELRITDPEWVDYINVEIFNR